MCIRDRLEDGHLAERGEVIDARVGARVRAKDEAVLQENANTVGHTVRLLFEWPPCEGWSGDHFVGPDPKGLQGVGAKGGGDRNVGGVAAARDEDASGARNVVAWIERVPGIPEIGLEPSREVHR